MPYGVKAAMPWNGGEVSLNNVDSKSDDPKRNVRKWYNSILEANGSTPLTKLNKIPQSLGVNANIYVKMEYLNVGGSVDDRSAIKLLENAESHGLSSGQTVVAAAGGNFAVAIALVCASKSYKCVIVSSQREIQLVENILTTSEATIVRSEDGFSREQQLTFAKSVQKNLQNSFYLDVSSVDCKAQGTTAAEIIEALPTNRPIFPKVKYSFKVDAVVVPVNGGFALAGILKHLRTKAPRCKVFAAVAADDNDAIPELSTRRNAGALDGVDGVEEFRAKETYAMALRLSGEEGVMAGPSTAAALLGAFKVAKQLSGSNIVIVAADGIRNYLDHYIDSEWMLANKFIAEKPQRITSPQGEYDPEWFKYDITRPAGHWNTDSRGQWSDCEYTFKPYRTERPAIANTVLDAIGNTPLVKLQHIPAEYDVKCNIYVKCEYLSSGGSMKDRIALRMVEIAEAEGRLRPGMTIIEPSSGNTGIGVAMVAAVKGYPCIIVMPMKMSKEKALVMEALGATVVRSPNGTAYDSPNSHLNIAVRLQHEIPNSVILDQYRNIGNPLAHYEQTAEEIIDSLDGNVDYVVIGAGTGGLITGIARKIRDKVPKCKVIAVDPEGSLLADPEHEKTHFYEIEGLGHDFVPGSLDRTVIDGWVKTDDKESFQLARLLLSKEGILSGGSSGANLLGALKIAKGLPRDKNVVVVLPDGIRNYITKFLDDGWMNQRHFLE